MADENSFWVLYKHHTSPTLDPTAGEQSQIKQRNAALGQVRNWRVCLDIGSNVGQWTRPLAKKFQSVICFEPNPNFRECFNKNITEHNVLLWPFGLSDKEHNASQGFNSTELQMDNGDVQCRTLDSFKLTNVDFIEIDVDGFELPLLRGATHTLLSNNPVINIEMKRNKYQPARKQNHQREKIVNQCDRILRDLGYRFLKRTKSDEIWLKL